MNISSLGRNKDMEITGRINLWKTFQPLYIGLRFYDWLMDIGPSDVKLDTNPSTVIVIWSFLYPTLKIDKNEDRFPNLC